MPVFLKLLMSNVYYFYNLKILKNTDLKALTLLDSPLSPSTFVIFAISRMMQDARKPCICAVFDLPSLLGLKASELCLVPARVEEKEKISNRHPRRYILVLGKQYYLINLVGD
jgi:hypothetical protein